MLLQHVALSRPVHSPDTMSASDSYIITDMAASEDHDDLDSLPSISSGVLSSEADSTDAQKEWEESLEQIQLLLTMIIVPFAGKFLGRKFAYWSTLPCPCPARDRMDPTIPGNSVTDHCYFTRLGTVYGVDAQRRDTVDEQEDLRGYRCCRGRRNSVSTQACRPCHNHRDRRAPPVWVGRCTELGSKTCVDRKLAPAPPQVRGGKGRPSMHRTCEPRRYARRYPWID